MLERVKVALLGVIAFCLVVLVLRGSEPTWGELVSGQDKQAVMNRAKLVRVSGPVTVDAMTTGVLDVQIAP